MQLVPYLNFNGQCAEAFKFYQECLGGEITAQFTFGEMPGCEEMPAEFKSRIMHARLVIGDTEIMGSDAPPQHAETAQGFAVAIQVTDPAEAEKIFAALEPGATVQMPMGETGWSTRFGMLTDRFGTPWMVNCAAQQTG